jgi:hypothetical protein
MNITLTKIKCLGCGVKLTEYEVSEKKQYCIECYEEKRNGEQNK